ncbi:hypothetical protein GFL38_05830 [Rhizobium leguminosarum bv. viciae]|uniref:hypothetical protein n=1 Tax=Rhizobium ruizarguesonis TaxID=2081791 RepID=UPI00143F62EF|nr:hypothetical protein [Rhizobium ruizarguesonis]NKJ71812.1 hypothetical protein [Rhizobium leguminosarum bv. viciae]
MRSLILILAVWISLAAIIDPNATGPEAPLLKAWASSLGDNGLDVVLGAATDHPLAGRTRVASLAGYAPNKQDWGSFQKDAWAMAFADGRSGVLFAVKKDPKYLTEKKSECVERADESEACDFVVRWTEALPDMRVFLAFTSTDFEAANAVRQALEKEGYVVFVFLKGKHEAPWASAALAGEVFAQATHRLVIDSMAARGSEGVRFESLCCEAKLVSPPAPTKWSKLLGR